MIVRFCKLTYLPREFTNGLPLIIFSEARTSWILPFTAGGFLHIGLVTVLPELLQETNPKESLKQLAAILVGISLMAFMTAICD